MTSRVNVHLGEASLPRFGDGWMYGDLHYHSQGTDNEGESGYAYRPTIQAARAMGLDFLFATDHASNSGQVTDMDPIFVDRMPDIPYAPEVLERWAQDFINKKIGGYNAIASVEAARDMNQTRFSAMRAWLNGWDGANAQIMHAFEGGRRPARLFLGGEVDVIPEISAAERASGSLLYGNNRIFRWGDACTQVPSAFLELGRYTTADTCPDGPAKALADDAASEGGRYLVKDLQGLIERFYARQHIVWLPSDGSRNDAFVASNSSVYGGAKERLKDILSPTSMNTMAGKGYAFLAHPVEAASGSDFGRLGPDILPYSDVQLRTAFESPVILGLQLWNEDTRLESLPDYTSFPTIGNAGPPKYGKWRGPAPKKEYRDLHDGLFAWDKMLQWGLRPSQTSSISWLSAGAPRRVFMAGGSDAHGDWNYRQTGALSGAASFVDTALGKPRNLVNVGLSRPETVAMPDGSAVGAVSQGQVTSALARGEFSVTDGPALRIAIDTNGNGMIDDGDVPMGGVSDFGNGTVNLLVEWKSTTEFQTVDSLDVYVGVAHSASDRTLVYAPQGHGIHAEETKSGNLDPNLYRDPSAVVHRMLADGYAADPTGVLHIVPTSADYIGGSYWGRRKIVLRASDFPVGVAKSVVTYGPEVCTTNPQCNKKGAPELCKETCTQPMTTKYVFESPATPDRMYLRAFARTKTMSQAICSGTSWTDVDTQLKGRCIERLAFSNPVWAVPTSTYFGGGQLPISR